jgi:hypothetical protein
MTPINAVVIFAVLWMDYMVLRYGMIRVVMMD